MPVSRVMTTWIGRWQWQEEEWKRRLTSTGDSLARYLVRIDFKESINIERLSQSFGLYPDILWGLLSLVAGLDEPKHICYQSGTLVGTPCGPIAALWFPSETAHRRASNPVGHCSTREPTFAVLCSIPLSCLKAEFPSPPTG